MQLILTVLHLALAIGLVGLILIQHGRGADAGAAFGSGASGTVFGAQGSGSFLTRSTAVIATLFFLTSMTLAYFAAQVGEPQGLMDDVAPPAPIIIDSGDVPMPDLPASPVGATDGAAVGDQIEDVPVPAPSGGPSDIAPEASAEKIEAPSQDVPATELPTAEFSASGDSAAGETPAAEAADGDMAPSNDMPPAN